MIIIVFLTGLVIGFFLYEIIIRICRKASMYTYVRGNILSIFAYALCFTLSYIFLGTSYNFFKADILAALLVIISFVDIHTKTIPDYMVLITLSSGIILSLIGGTPVLDIFLGMLCGGGLLFILSLVPNSLGGGDIKLMFALGAYLGFQKTLYSAALSFIAASIASILLLIFKVYGRKDHIPFGPFLALGSFISLMFFI